MESGCSPVFGGFPTFRGSMTRISVAGILAMALMAGCSEGDAGTPNPPAVGTDDQNSNAYVQKKDDSRLIAQKYRALKSEIRRKKANDFVVTIEGKRIEGNIIQNNPTGVVLQKKFGGKVTVPRLGIKQVDLSGRTLKEFNGKLTKAEASTGVDDLVALQTWTQEKKLPECTKLVAWAILKVDQENKDYTVHPRIRQKSARRSGRLAVL